MRAWAFIVWSVLISPITVSAQTWQPIANESFERVWAEGDSALIIRAERGEYFRSLDAGERFTRVEGNGQRVEGGSATDSGKRIVDSVSGAVIVLDDSSNILLSRDKGSSWERVFYLSPPPSPQPSPQGERENNIISLHAIALLHGVCYAVGEPGLVLVSDSTFTQWREMHRAPYFNYELRMTNDKSTSFVDFWSPTIGALYHTGNLFVTYDSCVSWRRIASFDSVSAIMMTSDTSVLVASGNSVVEVGMDGPGSAHTTRGRIIQLGWTDRWLGEIYVVTDSNVYFTDLISLEGSKDGPEGTLLQAMPYTLPAGQHVRAAAFPDKYDGYLVADTMTRLDTTLVVNDLTVDTTIVYDTSHLYRTTDGGGSWSEVYAGPYRFNTIYFFDVAHGFVCGDRGAMLRTQDSGRLWSRAYVPTRQNLQAIRFVNDRVGYVVGDSGVVAMTAWKGMFWRVSAPDPLFQHPATRYSAIAFPDAHSVIVVGDDKAYREPVRDPMQGRFRFRRGRRAELQPLVVTVSPNPSGGVVRIHIVSKNASTSGDAPTLSIIDAAGRTIIPNLTCSLAGQSEWNAEADLTYLQTALYVAVATLDGASGRANIVVQH